MTLKQFFQQDRPLVGVLAVVSSELALVLPLATILLLMGMSVGEHLRWFAAAAVPALLVVRAYAKHREALQATKAAIVTLFITFIIFMFILTKTRAL